MAEQVSHLIVAGTQTAELTAVIQFLRQHTYAVTLAETAVACLALLSTQKPDFILVGPVVPDMPRDVLIARIKAVARPDQTLLLSLPFRPADTATLLADMADDVLELPADPAHLQLRLRALAHRQHAERRAQEAASRLDEVARVLPYGLVWHDADGRITQCNRQAQAILDVPATETLTGRHWSELGLSFVDEDGALVSEAMCPMLGARQSDRAEPFTPVTLGVRNENGRVCWLTFYALLARPAGSAERPGYVVVLEDVTERKKAEAVLHMKEAALASAVNGIIISDFDGRILYVNKALLTMWGYANENEVVGTLSNLYDADYAPVSEMEQSLSEKGSWMGELSGTGQDGRPIFMHVSANVVHDAAGRPLWYLATIMDVSERKRTELALQESEARYRAVVTASPSAVLVAQNGRFIFANPAAMKLLGHKDPAELYRAPLEEFLASANRRLLEERRQRLGMGQPNPPVEWEFRLADGSTIWVESTSLPITWQGKTATLVVGHDVTERKMALARQQATETLLRYQLELSQAWRSAFTFDDTMRLCLSVALNVSEMDTAVLHLYDDKSSQPTQVYCGARTPEYQALAQKHSQHDPNIFRQNLKYGSVYFRHPPVTAPAETDAPVTAKSGANIPLYYKGRLIGGLSVATYNLDAIPEQARTALATIANQIGGVIVHAQAEDKLLQLSRVVEQSPVSIVITSRDGVIEYVNPKFTRLTGYTLAEAVGQKPSILKSGHTPQHAYETLWQTILDGREWQGEFCNIKKNGEYYWESALISPIFSAAGEITHFLAVKEDITTARRMQKELEKRNKELQLLNRAGATISSSLDLDQVLIFILEEIRSMLNVIACSAWLVDPDTDELVCRQVTDPMAQFVKGWRLERGQGVAGWVAQHGKSLIVEDVSRDSRHYGAVDARTGMPVRSMLTVPLMLHQEVIGVFQVVDGAVGRFEAHDQEMVELLTAVAANAIENARLHDNLKKQYDTLKRTQTRLVQSEKLAAIGEIVAGVAHELNNPLAAIMLYSQLLQRKGAPPEIQHDLDQIAMQSRRASNIVRGLLDFARQRPPERQPTLVNDVIVSTLNLLAYELRTHNIEVFTHLAEEIPATLADLHQLQQVFVNLINNASQAMLDAHQGGYLTITTEMAVSAGLGPDMAERPVIRLTFQDDGPGIPLAMQTRIFDPFFTTKEEGRGTGLGLSVCHGIVREHGGDIWVESQENQGARFIIELPLTEETAVSLPALPHDPPPNDSLPAAPHHILVIDDEPSLVHVLTNVLRHQNFMVETAVNGTEGLAKLAQFSYDLIICDLRMPGMGGIEFYEQASVSDAAIGRRMIFTTGDMINFGTLRFLKSNDLIYLSKPFEIADLLEVVRARLQS